MLRSSGGSKLRGYARDVGEIVIVGKQFNVLGSAWEILSRSKLTHGVWSQESPRPCYPAASLNMIASCIEKIRVGNFKYNCTACWGWISWGRVPGQLCRKGRELGYVQGK